ncbi:RepB family plasmid replication initiator protein, partial [Escherichia coli]|nr:RepB family plasmid replication initiator protein [Escherichia coli]
GTKRKFEHGLWDVDAQMHVSDVIFSGRDYNEIIAALDSLAGRFFTYEDDEEWWKCGFISNPKYKKHTGIITFRVSNDLWDVFTKFAKGYREFELNKALALPTGYSLRFYMLMSGQVYPLDISLDNLKERLGIPADKYKDKNGKDRIDNFEERVLKPAKAALDESCPYTFNYVKVRENPNNKRSKVTGFRFYPVYQPQFRDEELEVKELQAKVTARHQIDSHVYEYLRYSCGFTSEEINRNKETFITAQENITDLIRELAILNGKSREKNNPKGWIINALKGKIKEYSA